MQSKEAIEKVTMFDELNKLPRFTMTGVYSQDRRNCVGKFDSPINLGDGWIGYLASENGLCVEGKFYDYSQDTLTAVFKPEHSKYISRFHIGKPYAFLDGYWGERVELVMDAKRLWRKELFKPRDAVQYKSGNSLILGPVNQSPSFPVDGEDSKIPGGWDHEHCAICWEKIAEYAEPFGYTNELGEWVCEQCYSNYIQRKNLNFLDETAVAQIRGNPAEKPHGA